jgi:hypothetical protein
VAKRGTEFKQQQFIEWLCTPPREREPRQQGDFAKTLCIASTRLSEWKRDPDFVKRWEAHYLMTIGSPERKSSLMDTLYKTGSDNDDPRHVTAAKTYMEIVEGLRPQQIELTVRRPAQDLTDEQLDVILTHHAERERKLRLVDPEAS